MLFLLLLLILLVSLFILAKWCKLNLSLNWLQLAKIWWSNFVWVCSACSLSIDILPAKLYLSLTPLHHISCHTPCTVSYCLSLSTTPIWHWNRAWKTLHLYPFPLRFVHYLTVGPSTHQVFPEYQPIQFPYTALLRIYRISPEGRAPKIHTHTQGHTHILTISYR